MRNLHPDTLARLKTSHKRCKLVALNLTPNPVYLTDAPVDIEYDNNLYLANGLLLKMGNFKQTIDIRVGSLPIEFSAVTPEMVALLLGSPQDARDVSVLLAILNDDYSIAGLPIIMSSMIVDGEPKIIDDPSKGVATIKQKISSEFANWKMTNGRRTTESSQKKHFPNDTGLAFAAEAGKEHKWGRK